MLAGTTYLHLTALMVVEPEGICVQTTGERSIAPQVYLPSSVPLEAEHYLWDDNAWKRERDASCNGSSSLLLLEEELFPVSDQED